MFQIEKNVPMPSGYHHKEVYPWREMAVGDSFVVRNERSHASLSSTAGGAGKRLGMKFTVRKQPDGSFRIWRKA